MKSYIVLAKINLINVFRRDIAYFGNNWLNIFSTFFYMLTQIIFVEFLFGNVAEIAGVTKNHIYIFMLFGQMAFFLQQSLTYWGTLSLADDVNRGNLDLVLTKPVPTRWHIYTKSISLLVLFRDSAPSLLPLLMVINFSEINLAPLSMLAGVVVFMMGFVVDHLLLYSLAMTSFWSGSSDFATNFFWAERTRTNVPFEALSPKFKTAIFVGLPAYITGSLAASVALGYTSALTWLTICFIAMIAWIIFNNFIWRKALMQYSSASS